MPRALTRNEVFFAGEPDTIFGREVGMQTNARVYFFLKCALSLAEGARPHGLVKAHAAGRLRDENRSDGVRTCLQIGVCQSGVSHDTVRLA